MRYMIIVRATAMSEAGIMPDDPGLMADMAAYHEELAKAGVLLDAAGLQPSAKGWRVRYGSGKRAVVDGPFAETKELIAGYTRDPGALAGRGAGVVAALSARRSPSDGEIEVLRDRGSATSYELARSPARPATRAAVAVRRGSDAADGAAHRAIDAVWRIESAQDHRRPGAHGARRRPGRGAGAGRAGRRARALAARRACPTTRAPG